MDPLLPAIAGSSELTLLSSAIEAAGIEDAFTDRTLRATLFAPTNEAFEDALDSIGLTFSELANNTALLSALLRYHLVPTGVLDLADISRSTLIETALEDYNLIGGSRREIEGFASVGVFVGEPVEICRSVVYLIDNVLLPEGSLDELNAAFNPPPAPVPEPDQPRCREGFNAFFAISSEDDLSVFADLLNLVQLSGPLARETTSYTVFAPTNEAFNTTLESLNMTLASLQADEELLEGILRYHIIRTENLEASDLETSTLTTMNGSTIFVEVDRRVELAGLGSGASVIEADIDLSCQSAVHKIDNVLLPFRTQRGVVSTGSGNRRADSRTPARTPGERPRRGGCQVGNRNLYQVISGTQNLRVWTQIIQLSGLREYLADESISVTMFAPSDAAFGLLLPPGAGFSELVPQEDVARALVSYHTVSGAATTRQIEPDLEVETLLIDGDEEAVQITIEDNPLIPTRLMVAGQETTANIIQTDIIACNSVIHIIDGVLLPYADVFPSDTVTLDEAISNAEDYTSLLEEANTQEADEEEEEPRQQRRRNRRGRETRVN